MKLFEFFNIPPEEKTQNKPGSLRPSPEELEQMKDNVFWFIVDQDDLHKNYMLPLIKKYGSEIKDHNLDRNRFEKEWLPMINKGCGMYHKENELTMNPAELYNDLKDDLAKRFVEKIISDIQDDAYSIGSYES